MRARAIVLASVGLVACPDVELKEVPLQWWAEARVTRCIADPAKVDVLLVIDDSASMASERPRVDCPGL